MYSQYGFHDVHIKQQKSFNCTHNMVSMMLVFGSKSNCTHDMVSMSMMLISGNRSLIVLMIWFP